jgi:hypothetical protein
MLRQRGNMPKVSLRSALGVPAIHTLHDRSVRGLRVSLAVPDARSALVGEFRERISGVVLNPGRAWDLVGTYWASLYLVSPRFVDLLIAAGATGWKPRTVDIPGSPDLPPLALLTVTGRCGRLLPGGEGGRPPFGVFLDPSTWDGSDVFVADGDGAILLTGDLASRLRSARLSNVNIEPAGIEPWSA